MQHYVLYSVEFSNGSRQLFTEVEREVAFALARIHHACVYREVVCQIVLEKIEPPEEASDTKMKLRSFESW